MSMWHHRSRFLSALVLALIGAGGQAAAYEGFGYQTIGGQGGSTCHVTNLNASGAGSLLDCALNRSGPRIVVFDVGGTIVLGSILRITAPYLTIDGTTAPAPGITIRPSASDPGADSALVIENTHDVIIRGLRLVGYGTGGDADLLALDGTDGGEVYNVVLDHLSLTAADDGANDVTGNVHDVTVSWCFLYGNALTSLIKYDTRQRISIHHNLYIHNIERNPQVKGDMRILDFRNNIVYDWSSFVVPGFNGYGLRLWSGDPGSDSPGEPSLNIVGNAFIAKSPNVDCGIDLIEEGSTHVQRWVSDNLSLPSPLCVSSNLSGPLAIPAAAQVTTAPSSQLGSVVLPTVGMAYRNATEQALLDEIAALLPATPPPATRFYSLVPCRAVDTRTIPSGPYAGPALSAGQTRTFNLAGRCGIPATAKAVSLNVTVTAPTTFGHLSVYPAGSSANVSTINYSAGRARGNNAISIAGPLAGLAVHCGQASGTTHVILDVNGYFQ